jgi:hypothetical protein
VVPPRHPKIVGRLCASDCYVDRVPRSHGAGAPTSRPVQRLRGAFCLPVAEMQSLGITPDGVGLDADEFG